MIKFGILMWEGGIIGSTFKCFSINKIDILVDVYKESLKLRAKRNLKTRDEILYFVCIFE